MRAFARIRFAVCGACRCFGRNAGQDGVREGPLRPGAHRGRFPDPVLAYPFRLSLLRRMLFVKEFDDGIPVA